MPSAARNSAPDEPLFCCYGCGLAARVTTLRGEAGRASWMLNRLGISAALTMTVMMFSMYLYRQEFTAAASDTAAVQSTLGSIMRYLSLAFATPVLILLGLPLAESAAAQARRGIWSVDVLVAAGVAAAFIHSYYATLRDAGGIYFETACAVLVFMTLGRWLEAEGKLRARGAVATLDSLFPEQVRVERNGELLSMAAADVRMGDIVIVPAGQRIAVDGRIVSGAAHVDASLVTGESTPLAVDAGDRVAAGTLNLDGTLRVAAESVGAQATLGRLSRLLELARAGKGRFEQLAERLTRAFIPLTLVLAVVAAGLGARRGGIEEAVLSFLAVLLIACPCALGIATPMAAWAALGAAARRGVVFRDGEALERLASVQAVCFDKTGTLTANDCTVQRMTLAPETPPGIAAGPYRAPQVLALAAGLAEHSTHALSRGIVDHARRGGIQPVRFERVRTIPGRGVVSEDAGGSSPPLYSGGAGGGWFALGSPQLMDDRALHWPPELRVAVAAAQAGGAAVVCIGANGSVAGVIELGEQLRPAAAQSVAALRSLVGDVRLLSGDHEVRARRIAGELGIECSAGMDPAAKLAAIGAQRRRYGAVAMIGDGLNDAPALAAADVSIAMGCGADVSRDAAMICLLGDDVSLVPWLIELSRRTVRTIRWNLFWAFSYNVVGVGLAVAGWLNPIFAAAAMVLSSTLVIANSRRLAQEA